MWSTAHAASSSPSRPTPPYAEIGKNTRAYEGNEESAEPEGMARKEYEQKCTHPELRKELLEDQHPPRAAERPQSATPRSGVREEGQLQGRERREPGGPEEVDR